MRQKQRKTDARSHFVWREDFLGTLNCKDRSHRQTSDDVFSIIWCLNQLHIAARQEYNMMCSKMYWHYLLIVSLYQYYKRIVSIRFLLYEERFLTSSWISAIIFQHRQVSIGTVQIMQRLIQYEMYWTIMR